MVAAGTTAIGQLLKLDYGTYLGGSGADAGYAIAVDGAGSVYVAGFTQSADFPVINALQPYFGAGTGDLFVAKFKSDASGFEYITYLGGSGGEGDPGGHIGGIAVDAQGNAYLVGVTRSSDFPTTPGAYQTTIASQFVCDDDPNAGLCGDAFVAKLDPRGKLLYSTYLGGNDYDDAKAIAVDNAGCAYVTGMTASLDFPTTAGAFQPGLRDVDAYVAKLSADGSTLLYSTLLGGTGLDAGMAIAVDGSGRAYVAGTTEAADFPIRSGQPTKSDDSFDAFIVRLNATGTGLEFSRLVGGSGTDEAFGIALDAQGSVYVTGYTDSQDFPAVNAFQPNYGGGDGNGFVVKLRGDGSSIVYSTFLGGTDGRSELNAIVVDSVGRAIVAGRGGSDFPVVNGLQSYGGSSDAVVAGLTPDGSGLQYSTFVGGAGTDVANGVAVDSAGRIVVTGQTSSPDLAVSAGALPAMLHGPSDAFLLRLVEITNLNPVFSSPKMLSVGAAYVGRSSATKSLRISNTGTQPLTVTGITGSSNVTVTDDCATVTPTSSCSISASLFASAPGDQAGTITAFDNAPDSPQTIVVRAVGVNGGDLELRPLLSGSRFAFYGKTAIPLTATIVNHGPYDSDDVQLDPSADGGSFDCDPCYVGHIVAGQSAVVRFNFVPARHGTLTISAHVEASPSTPDLNPGNDAQTVIVTNPRYRVDPAQLAFPSQIVGIASSPQRVTFTALDGNSLLLSASATGDFRGDSWCDSGGLRCYADVVLFPTVAGTRTGTLMVNEATAGTAENIALSGTAILAPHVHFSTSLLNFGQQFRGGPVPPQTLTLTNDGSAPLFVVSISTSRYFSDSTDCPPTLAPGASCNVSVRFLPSVIGSCSGSLTLADNAASLLDVVALTGTGIPIAILSRPARPVTPIAAPGKNGAQTPSIQTITRPSRPPGRVFEVKTQERWR